MLSDHSQPMVVMFVLVDFHRMNSMKDLRRNSVEAFGEKFEEFEVRTKKMTDVAPIHWKHRTVGVPHCVAD